MTYINPKWIQLKVVSWPCMTVTCQVCTLFRHYSLIHSSWRLSRALLKRHHLHFFNSILKLVFFLLSPIGMRWAVRRRRSFNSLRGDSSTEQVLVIKEHVVLGVSAHSSVWPVMRRALSSWSQLILMFVSFRRLRSLHAVKNLEARGGSRYLNCLLQLVAWPCVITRVIAATSAGLPLVWLPLCVGDDATSGGTDLNGTVVFFDLNRDLFLHSWLT